jgi:hypothetical protein
VIIVNNVPYAQALMSDYCRQDGYCKLKRNCGRGKEVDGSTGTIFGMSKTEPSVERWGNDKGKPKMSIR